MGKKHPQLMKLGEQIRKIRKSKEFSQARFPLFVGLDRSYFSGIERGERNIAAINLIAIAYKLEVEVSDLFPAMKNLIEQYALLNAHGRISKTIAFSKILIKHPKSHLIAWLNFAYHQCFFVGFSNLSHAF